MPTTPPTITPAPDVPQRSIRATFGKLVDAFNTWKAASVSQFAAVALNCFNNAKEAYDSAVAAAGWASLASDKAVAADTSAGSAANSALAAAAINGAAPWVSGSTYQQFAHSVSRINFRTYVKKTTAATNNGGATDPANDPTNWEVKGAPSMPRSERTANAVLTAKDLGAWIDIVSGAFTQTFETSANLGAGWYCYLRNLGTGDITIPSSDGRTNWIMYPGEERLFQCDGTVLRSKVLKSFSRTFTTTGTFVKPPGYGLLGGQLWSAGEGGMEGNTSSSGLGAIGGRYVQFLLDSNKFPLSVAVQVAAATPNRFATPGNSSIGSLISADASPFSENGAFGGDYSVRTGRNATYAGAGGGMGQDNSNTPAAGGTSKHGGYGGSGGGRNQAGGAGVAPGGGGGGGGIADSGSTAGGIGARGEVQIWGVM